MTLMQIQLQIGNEGWAVFNPVDVQDLDLQNGQLICIYDEDGFRYCVLKAYIDERAPRDVILGDRNALQYIGIENDSLVEFEPFTGTVIPVTNAVIEFNTLDTPAQEIFRPENQNKLIQFIEKYYFTPVVELYWPEFNTYLRVTIHGPALNPNQIYQINSALNPTIRLQEQVQSMPFNAILLVDHSGSMNRHDVSLGGINDVIDSLEQSLLYGLDGGSRRWNYQALNKFLNDVKSDTNPENAIQRTSRLNAVLLATLMFFQQKISRGMGEKCSFILYADDAAIVQVNHNAYIDATEFNPDVCEQLISIIKSNTLMAYGKTNISAGLAYCEEIARVFKSINGNPLMILLLTDGKPSPRNLDNPRNVRAHATELKNSLRQAGIPFVMYTIGLGEREAIDQRLLQDIAEECHGEFHFAESSSTLIQWYERLAGSFSQSIQFGGNP
ncbi:MAG: vWA domain-containing protein [Promethearchaeota archaeon]